MLPGAIAAKVTVDAAGCWIWTGAATQHGYGVATAHQGARLVHRIAYLSLVGPIPEGLQIDHLCRVTRCCNPEHLEPVTAAENNRRAPGWLGNRTHCKNGHPLFGPNLYVEAGGVRRCRECSKAGRIRRRDIERLKKAS